MRYQLLGTVQATAPDGRSVTLGGYRQRLVLSLLLLHAREPVTTDRLIDQVWGEDPPPTARKTLQVYISRLRRALDNGDIVAGRSSYQLDVDTEQVDAAVFAELAAEGRRLLDDDPAAAAARLRSALGLWRGAPWGELGGEPALAADAERLRELRLTVLEDRIAADLAVGSGAPQIGELRALISEHPLRERLRGLLMIALYREGLTADALAVFEDGRALLADELGADPGPALRAVHERILRQDPDLLPTTQSAPAPDTGGERPNPYKGLQAFGESDAAEYFGRDDLVEVLRTRLATSSLTVLVGPSGSGKSSVVRAGLVPSLREADPHRPIARMVPGAHPFAELEAALASIRRAGDGPPAFRGDELDLLRAVLQVASEEAPLVLVIDQFEELFLQVADEAERERFLRNLAEAVEDPHSRVSVLAVLRADLLDRPMTHARLGPLLSGALVQVLPLSPAELETACVGPAAQIGTTVEPELVAELVAEVADHPGALPMFQYTLSTLFERGAGATMTLADYRTLGGVQGVIAGRAEEIHATLGTAARAVCRQVFLRLVTVGDEGEVGRRRARRAELSSMAVDPAGAAEVLERFAAARLLAFDRDGITGEATVEVAHEALLREWPRLAGWIEEGRSDLRVHRWVALAAAEWESSGRQDAYLLSGARLDIAADWRTRAATSATETAFVDASLDQRRQEEAAEQERRRRELELEQRASGRLRQLVAVLSVAALLAAGLGTWAFAQRREAIEQADTARAAAELIRARTLANAAVANRQVDPERSVLLALHATDLMAQAGDVVPQAVVEALHWSVQAAGIAYPADAPVAAAPGPDGRRGLFVVPVDELYALGRAHVSRELTSAECRSFFDTGDCPSLPTALVDVTATAPDRVESGADALAGTRVTVAGPFGGGNSAALEAEFERVTDETGIDVVYEAPADLESWLVDAVESHGEPDIVLLPQPGFLMDLAQRGQVVDVSAYLPADRLTDVFSPHLVGLVSAPGAGSGVYGVPIRLVDKSLLWYAPEVIEAGGYALPTTYEELLSLSARMVEDGLTPWCHGEGSGFASGWPGTDVVERLLLHASIEDYDAWLDHDIGFDDAPLHRAFERMRDLLLAPGHVVGGPPVAATRDYEVAAQPLWEQPPGCVFYPLASFAAEFFPLDVRIGRDVEVLPFPSVGSDGAPVVLGAGDYAAALADRPEVRVVMEHLATGDFGSVWAAQERSFISARNDFPVDSYGCDGEGPGHVLCAAVAGESLGERLTAALAGDRFRFDGSDVLPHGMGLEPMWSAMVAFVAAGGENLDEVLADLEATWDEREQEAAAET